MKIFLEQTFFGKRSNVGDYAKNSRQFLIENVNRMTLSREDELKIFNTHDPLTRTLVSELYSQAVVENKINIIKPILLDSIDKIPSWFLISWLDIDTLILQQSDKQSANILNTLSEFKNKIIVDITSYYNQKLRMIRDTGNFYSRIIRNLLCRSYFADEKAWMTPNILYYLTKIYSSVLSAKISKIYNLSYQEQLVISTILTVYFVNRCHNHGNVIQPVMSRMDFIRTVETKGIFEYIDSKYTDETFDIKAAIDCIVDMGPSRLSNFNISTFFQMNLNITSNQAISLLSLEFPPYWAYVVFLAVSGDKTNLYHTMKSLRLDKEIFGLKNDILKTNSFIRSL